MPHFAVIDAPNILGLKPNGVERLPEALKAAGLLAQLNGEYAGRVEPLPYNPRRDPEMLILNPDALRNYSLRLAEAVGGVLREGKFPLRAGSGAEWRSCLDRFSDCLWPWSISAD